MPEPPIKKVFIGGLSFDTEESDLKMFFEKYGKVSWMMSVSTRPTCTRPTCIHVPGFQSSIGRGGGVVCGASPVKF